MRIHSTTKLMKYGLKEREPKKKTGGELQERSLQEGATFADLSGKHKNKREGTSLINKLGGKLIERREEGVITKPRRRN